jgi:hypothetical protein
MRCRAVIHFAACEGCSNAALAFVSVLGDHPAMDRTLLQHVGLVVAGGALVAGSLLWRNSALATAGWPTVQADVQSVEIQHRRYQNSGTQNRYTPRIQGTYTVDGREYTEISLYASAGEFVAEASATEALIDHGVVMGGTVLVHYDPARPGRAVVVPRPGPKSLRMFWLGVVVVHKCARAGAAWSENLANRGYPRLTGP